MIIAEVPTGHKERAEKPRWTDRELFRVALRLQSCALVRRRVPLVLDEVAERSLRAEVDHRRRTPGQVRCLPGSLPGHPNPSSGVTVA